MEKFKELLQHCKNSVRILVNEHRDLHWNVEEYFEEERQSGGISSETISPEVMEKMIETDTVIFLQFYPNTPVGFYSLWHYDLNAILEEALAIIKEQG